MLCNKSWNTLQKYQNENTVLQLLILPHSFQRWNFLGIPQVSLTAFIVFVLSAICSESLLDIKLMKSNNEVDGLDVMMRSEKIWIFLYVFIYCLVQNFQPHTDRKYKHEREVRIPSTLMLYQPTAVICRINISACMTYLWKQWNKMEYVEKRICNMYLQQYMPDPL